MSLSTLKESTPQTAVSRSDWRSLLRLITVLFKLRIVFLLVVAATGGAFMAAEGWPGWNYLLLVWITGGSAAAGAASLNQYLERHSDGDMGRTKKRPLVTGDVYPSRVWFIGVILVLLPSLTVLPFNPPLTFFLLLGAIIYVGIYTIWLKPRTILNIVIGGAAGSAAVLSGGAAVGAWNHPGVLVLALILFLWTPFHFWSLAILYRNEYQQADIPMLPANIPPRHASLWVLSHTLPTALATILLAALPSVSWVYLIPISFVTFYLIYCNLKLVASPTPYNARTMFMASNKYLLLLLVTLCLDMVV